MCDVLHPIGAHSFSEDLSSNRGFVCVKDVHVAIAIHLYIDDVTVHLKETK